MALRCKHKGHVLDKMAEAVKIKTTKKKKLQVCSNS